MKSIQTPRLLLRPLTPEIYDHVFTTLSDAELMEFFGCRTEEELREEHNKFRQGLSMYRKSFLVFQLMEIASGSIIGWCGYHTWYLPHSRAEIGYVLSDESKRGQGYMKEALPFVLQYGFEEMELKRIEALVGPNNEASLRLIRSMGFVQEGLLREHYFTNGRFEDSLFFSLLQREFVFPVNNLKAILS